MYTKEKKIRKERIEMIGIFSSIDQLLLFLVAFGIVVLFFAVLIDRSNGLFLARNPLNVSSYETTPENEAERKAGKLFVYWAYRGVSVLIPICLFLHSGILSKLLAILFIIGNVYLLTVRKK
ncbi:hypothetical protein RV18_GL002562 [Enterococcus termitis]|nr:hypothetical protein RV18_GL002562 [Enterococcus termitis]